MKNKLLLALCLVSSYVQCAQVDEDEQENIELIEIFILPSPNDWQQDYMFNTLPRVTVYGEDGIPIQIRRSIIIEYYHDGIAIIDGSSDRHTIEILRQPEFENVKDEFVTQALQHCPGRENELREALRDIGLILPLLKMDFGSFPDDSEDEN